MSIGFVVANFQKLIFKNSGGGCGDSLNSLELTRDVTEPHSHSTTLSFTRNMMGIGHLISPKIANRGLKYCIIIDLRQFELDIEVLVSCWLGSGREKVALVLSYRSTIFCPPQNANPSFKLHFSHICALLFLHVLDPRTLRIFVLDQKHS